MIHCHLSYGTLLWGMSAYVNRVFIAQKRSVRILAGKKTKEHCKPLFRQLGILTLYAIYIMQAVVYIQNIDTLTHGDVHNYNTRGKSQLMVPFHRINRSKTGPNYLAYKIYNKIPSTIHLALSKSHIIRRLRRFLLQLAPYSVDEFMQCDISTF